MYNIIPTYSILKGGSGSGNFGHEGRPGEVGGSGGGGGGESSTGERSLSYSSASIDHAVSLDNEWHENFPNEPEGPY